MKAQELKQFGDATQSNETSRVRGGGLVEQNMKVAWGTFRVNSHSDV